MLKRIFVIICSNWPSIQYNTQVRRHEMASRPSCSLSNSMKFELNAQPLRRDDFWPFWIISFEFVKVPCWIRFSSWESFIRFYAWRYPISTILACFFTVGVRISWKSCVRNGAWRPRCHLVPPTLCIILYGGWIWASYHENSFEHLGQQQLTAEPVEPPWSTMKHPPLSIKWLQPSQQEFSHCCHLY